MTGPFFSRWPAIKLPARTMIAVVGCLGALSVSGLLAQAAPTADGNLKAGRTVSALTVSGIGAAPSSQVTMMVGTQRLTALASEAGEFVFPQLSYDFNSKLLMNFSVPVVDDKKKPLPQTTLAMTLNPRGFRVQAEGTATKMASIVVSTSGKNSSAGVANMEGYYRLNAGINGILKPAETNIVASIINVKEDCCPRVILPQAPVTIAFRGQAITLPPVAQQTLKTTPQIPVNGIKPQITKKSAEPVATPEPAPVPAAKPLPKPLMLPSFGRSGSLTYGTVTHVASWQNSQSFGAYTAGTEDGTWVEGLRLLAAQLTAVITMEGRMIGGFIDAQAHLTAQRSLQVLAAEAVNDYQPSEALCTFGSLSKGLSASETKGIATKRALSSALEDHETMRRMTAYGLSTGDGDFARVREFRNIYCDTYDESNGLATFCDAAADNRNFNKDVDYTRFFDVPLTLPVNFTTGANAAQQRGNADVLSYANNLFAGEAFRGFSKKDFEKDRGYLQDDVMDYRSTIAARSVVRNSFASLVGMKAEGTTSSTTYMKGIMSGLGLSTAEVDRLIGTNPSYYAQMEVLTKKIYQDPAFFVNLTERPANIERQRAAMMGINLQQQADLLDVLKRREMLLSVLLELRLRNRSETRARGN